jgi:hypothetical protein
MQLPAFEVGLVGLVRTSLKSVDKLMVIILGSGPNVRLIAF